MNNTTKTALYLLTAICLLAVKAHAALRPARIFSDDMVLQRGMAVPVWGFTDTDQRVTVTFAGQSVSVDATRDQRWQVRLQPMPVNVEPQSVTISGSVDTTAVELSNVVVGDVWLCLGQSNMEMNIGTDYVGEGGYGGVLNAEAELKDTDYPNLRLLNVPKSQAHYAVPDIAVRWEVSRPVTAEFFSAVAYFFGRELTKQAGVPIGVINVCMGGAPARRFTPREAMRPYPEVFKGELARLDRDRPGYLKRLEEKGTTEEQLKTAWEQEVIAFCATAQAQPPSIEWLRRNYRYPAIKERGFWSPGGMWYGMIAPLMPYGLKGSIWYQGESDLSRGEDYFKVLNPFIVYLRQSWGQGDFPFYAVELPPFNYHESSWPMRNAPLDQRDKLNRGMRKIALLPNTGTVNTDDLTGEEKSIHPRNKAPIGKRLARLALGKRGGASGGE
jgi:sialate O-acetylesterase